MDKIISMLSRSKGQNSYRLLLLLAVGFLYPKLEKIETRLTTVEADVRAMTRQAKNRTYESTNVFPLARAHGVQIDSD